MRTKQANPKKASSTYRQYSPSAMKNAFKAIKEKKMPIATASKMFGVPPSTLRERAQGKVDPDNSSSGPPPVLSQEEETLFVEHLKFMSSIGYGFTRADILTMASEYAFGLQKRDRTHPFSLKWFRNLLRRWPELNISRPRSISTARAIATAKDAVDNYYQELHKIMVKYNLLDRPELIYNLGEEGLQTDYTTVVRRKPSGTSANTSARSVGATLIGCGSAMGTHIPPYFVFQGQRMRKELLEGSTTGTDGTVTSNGLSNSEVYQKYLTDHFLQSIQKPDKDQHILVLYDGNNSHISLFLMKWAKEHNIILFVLPSHTSHVLLPHDLYCFGPFQDIYTEKCQQSIHKNPTPKVTRYNVCELACKSYTTSLTSENLKSYFRRAGIYPYNRFAIDTSNIIPSAICEEEIKTTPNDDDDEEDDDEVDDDEDDEDDDDEDDDEQGSSETEPMDDSHKDSPEMMT